jgi:hypothetical protein
MNSVLRDRSTHREKETFMDICARVDVLERRCRRLTLALFAMLAVAIAAAIVSANQVTTQPTIRTESLEIVDSNGRVRARFGKSDVDSVALTIQTPDGRTRLSLVGGERGGGISVFQGGQNTGGASLTAFPDNAGLTLRGPNGMLRANLIVEGDRVRLGLWNPDGKSVFAAPSSGIASN